MLTWPCSGSAHELGLPGPLFEFGPRGAVGTFESIFAEDGDGEGGVLQPGEIGRLKPPCRSASDSFSSSVVPIYTHRPGETKPNAAVEIRQVIEEMNWVLRDEAEISSAGARPLQFVFDCNAAGQVNVYDVATENETERAAIANEAVWWLYHEPGDEEDAEGEELIPSGYGKADKYLIFDSSRIYIPVGSGSNDATKDRTKNWNNKIYGYALLSSTVWDLDAGLHELFHGLGDVTNSAPLATSKSHCIDGVDLMCYNDGSIQGESYSGKYCPAAQVKEEGHVIDPIDCHNDNYFDPIAEPGEWLSTHYNVAEDSVYMLVPPSATTNAASNLWGMKATLNGTVNPLGEASQYFFEYGTSESYGSKTAVVSAGSGSSPVSASQTVTGLKPLTTYHFRLVAEKEDAAVYGKDLSFTTPAARAPQVSTTSASALSGHGATLNGTVNPEGEATEYWFEYGAGTSGPYTASTATGAAGSGTSAVAVSANVASLAENSSYHFRLVAKNAEGTTNGSSVSFTTTAADVLCKTAEDPCHESNRYSSGTSLAAGLKSGTKSVLTMVPSTAECSSSSLAGKLSGSGGAAQPVNFEITSASFSCGSATLKALGLPWHGWLTRSGAGAGIAHLSDFKLEAEAMGFNCIYSGAVDLAFKGGSTPELVGEGLSVPRTGGRSGAFCGSSGSWSVDYALSAPTPAYLASPVPLGSTVLCKAGEEPCASANQYGSGTSLAAALKSATQSKIESVVGNSECSTFNLAGKLTGAGGSGLSVPLEISSASLSGCNGTLKAIGLPWNATLSRTEGLATGTLRLSNLEIEEELFGFNCIYGGEAQLAFNSGSSPEAVAAKVSLKRTGGRSGAFCGSTALWSAAFNLSAPAPAWVEWP